MKISQQLSILDTLSRENNTLKFSGLTMIETEWQPPVVAVETVVFKLFCKKTHYRLIFG